MSVVEFFFRKAGEVFNFSKDRLHFVVPLGIWKIFRTDTACTPAASYFHYFVMPRSFLLDTRVFKLNLFRWQHWKVTSERLPYNISSGSSTITNFSCKHKLHTFASGCTIYSCHLYSRTPVGEVFLIC